MFERFLQGWTQAQGSEGSQLLLGWPGLYLQVIVKFPTSGQNSSLPSRYYEVIMIDIHHAAITRDPKINWMCAAVQKHRELRGLTAAGEILTLPTWSTTLVAPLSYVDCV